MTEQQHRDIKRATRNLAAVAFLIYTTLFGSAFVWNFEKNLTTDKLLALAAFVTLLPTITAWVYYQCELNFLAVKQTLLATKKHLMSSDGLWPQSWEQLKQFADDGFDLDWAASRVTIRFDIDTKTLIEQTPDKFDAIQYKTPCFVPRSEITELLCVINGTRKPGPQERAE